MNVAGIVSEYNPFHNGHRYMVEQVREKGATHIVAVMSGALVQRGEVAVFDKHYRAKMAVQNGVDLVIELPCPYSCSSGEIFARSAIGILAGLGKGVVDSIAFGCESDDISLLRSCAEATSELKDSDLVREKLSKGMSYPKAVSQTVGEQFGIDVAQVLERPNNTLAVEYIKASAELMPYADFIPIKRQYAEHDSDVASSGTASASHIRALLRAGENAEEFCPYPLKDTPTFSIRNAEREILFRLACAEKAELEQIFDCSSELADRIIKAMSQCPQNCDEFYSLCKSRNITLARLRRIVMHLVVGAVGSDIALPPFARVLAFNRSGAQVLAKCGGCLPVDTSLKALESTSDYAKRIVKLENNAVSFQSLCADGDYRPRNEFKRKTVIS